MHPSTTPRLLAACGLAYPVLTIIGFAGFPQPPGGDVSPAHDPSWLAAHTSAAIGQSYVRALAAVGLLALTAAVASRRWSTDDDERDDRASRLLVVLGGAACAILLLATQTTVLAAALASRDGVDPGAIRFADDTDAALLSLSSLPAVLLFAGAGLRFLRSTSVPRWLGILTLIGAPFALLDAASYDGGPFAALGLLGLAYFLVWSAATGIVLLRSDAERVAALEPTPINS